jgi:hypothetical protein
MALARSQLSPSRLDEKMIYTAILVACLVIKPEPTGCQTHEMEFTAGANPVSAYIEAQTKAAEWLSHRPELKLLSLSIHPGKHAEGATTIDRLLDLAAKHGRETAEDSRAISEAENPVIERLEASRRRGTTLLARKPPCSYPDMNLSANRACQSVSGAPQACHVLGRTAAVLPAPA